MSKSQPIDDVINKARAMLGDPLLPIFNEDWLMPCYIVRGKQQVHH